MEPISTQITAVTLYPDRARIRRSGRVGVQPGLQRLVVNDLPIQLLLDSVRASARGSARARLYGVQVQPTFFAEPQIEPVSRLEEQLELAQDDLLRVETQAGLLKEQRQSLVAVMSRADTFAMALAAGEMDLTAHLALMDGLRERAQGLEVELIELAARRREIERNLQKIRKELDQWRGQQGKELYTAAVEVEVLQAGELELELSYVVMGAAWQPKYDLRLLEESEQLELAYAAYITQTSGEDWVEAVLTLSTARPALANRPPELDPWFVRPQVQAPVPPPRPMAAARMLSKAEEALPAPEALPFEAEIQMATVEAGGATVTYRVPGKVNIPSDGAPHQVTVAQVNLASQLDYVTAPRLGESVYRRAKVINDSPYTLLPGAINLFHGDEFIGSARLDLVSPQAEVELYLGVDDRIKVERKLKRREVDKRLIGNRRRVVYGYEITLQNLADHAIRLTLHEGFPVSGHEEIKVRLEASEPRPSEQTELNLLNWNFSLASKEKQVVRYDFSVEFPVNMQVIGLP